MTLVWAAPAQDAQETLLVSDRTRSLLTSYLSSADPSARSLALDALRQAGAMESVADIRPLLDDSEPAVRAEAYAALGGLATPRELTARLAAACADPSESVARHALAMLARVPGSAGHDELLRVRDKLRPSLLAPWAAVLARRSERPPTSLLLDLLVEPDPTVRLAALSIVARAPEQVPLPRRLKLAGDAHPAVRARALEALGKDIDQPEVRRIILSALSDSSPWVRRSALDRLQQQPPDWHQLTGLLEDPDSTVRRAAVLVAGRVADDQVISRLVKRLADPEILVARSAADQLALRADDSVEAALVEVLDDATEQAVDQAARALGLRRRTGALEPLRSAAAHRSPQVRETAYRAIGQIGDSGSVHWLLERTATETGYPRAAVNEALGSIGDRAVGAHLIAECHHPDKKSKGIIPSLFTGMGNPPSYSAAQTAVATAAVRALGRMQDPAALETLVDLAYDVLRDEQFWTSIAWSLGQLNDARAAPALVQLGVVGEITQGQNTILLPDSTRSEALRSIGRLKLSDLSAQILAIEGSRCSLAVRKVAAEVLTALDTARVYRYRLPVRPSTFFLEDNATPRDMSPFKLPICYAVDNGGN